MLASKFQARWRTCPPIFGHSEFCVRRISRLLFRHDSIVIAYTRIFCKVPSSAWSSKKRQKNYLPPTENTRRGELNHVIFVSTKVIIAWQKVLASLVFLARLRFTSSEKKWCAYRDVRTSIHPGSSRVHTRFDDIMSLLFSDTMNA